jgi:hypothetical protein
VQLLQNSVFVSKIQYYWAGGVCRLPLGYYQKIRKKGQRGLSSETSRRKAEVGFIAKPAFP